MKYPKVLQILTIAAVVTTAVPAAAVPVQASEGRETPAEYEARTEYILPAGYHYILDDVYVILDENGAAVIEADPGAPDAGMADAGMADVQEPGASGEPEMAEGEIADGMQSPADSEMSDGVQTPADSEMSGGVQSPADSEMTADPETPEAPSDPENPVNPDIPGVPGEASGDPVVPSEPSDPLNPENPVNPDTPTAPGEVSGDPAAPSEPSEPSNPVKPDTPTAPGEGEKPELSAGQVTPAFPETPVSSLLIGEQPEIDISYLTSEEFKAIRDRIQYNVEVPIEGLPSFITQEMIVGALKAQDETGYPASVTIAQIIQESGFGKYGPGGEEGKGLSYLAYQYCNLFGIKGKGTAGSAFMNTLEMTAAGETYSTKAGFRAYHTYTECIEDRSKLLEEVYSDLTENVTDANTFAMKIGRRWATDINYGKSLIRTMQRYDLYRLDEMTLVDFSKLMGRFANPCPGSSISSTFGYRTFDHSFHKGLDLGTGTENIPTYAAEAGVVTFAGEAGSAGNLIIIDHGSGLVTKYMHHEEIYVEEGQEVEKGQQIGLSGTTGYSTGNHLHFQVEENGRAVDPIKYLQEENTETVKMREKVKVDINKIIENIKQR